MHHKFTFKAMGRFLKIAPVLLVLVSMFAGSTFAQCTWTASTVHPTATLDIPLATVGTNMYAFGGVQGGAITAASNKFDGTTWTAIAPLPSAVEFASAVSDGTNIYIMGGALVGTGAPQTSNFRYNVATNTYTTLAPMATGTWNHAAVFLNGKIYKIAGTAAAATNVVEIYDIASNTWTAGAAYPAARSFVSAAAIGNFVYTAGGNDGVDGVVKTYRYDPAGNTWNDAAIADLPAARWGAAGANYRGFTVAGGYVGLPSAISATVITWDPATDIWTAQSPMPSDRARITSAVLNDALYVVGGRSTAVGGFVGTNTNYKFQCPPLLPCAGTPAPGITFASATAVCAGTAVNFSVQNATAGSGVTYQWETSPTVNGTYTNAPGASTNPTYSTSPTVTAFYRVRVTCGASTGTSTPVQVSVSPCTCLTPDVATICEGAIQQITVTGAGTVANTTVSSGAISVAVPDADATGTTATLAVTLPAGASVTSVSVNFNMTHTWDGDMIFNLRAPNGKIFNLINQAGGSGDNFVNTTINTAQTTNPVAGGVAPFSAGPYAPSGALAVGPTAFSSNTALAGFFTPTITTGNWTLAMRDAAFGDLGTLTNWSITVNYVVLPTATWTGGAIFTDAAATVPYVAGTQANTVYVMPSVTTPYTATIASGPCAGANVATITVLPRPVLTVTPTSGCGPLTITASGAATYSWTPGTGLNTTTGPTVIANPNATTIYTVTGTGTNGCSTTSGPITVNTAATASVISALAGSTFQLQEGFTTVLPAGWARQNLSSPIGTTAPFNNWAQGDPTLFTAFNGPTNSYALANFQAGAGVATLSNWLFTPSLTIKNGDVFSFYTRTVDAPLFPDRMEVRMNTTNGGTNVGATATSVGDFTTVLFDINPTLTTTGYPSVWTRYTATISGITGTITGRIAFRHFVVNGGTAGANSDNIGVDQVEYSTPQGATCANTVTNLAVNITGGVGPFTVVYTNSVTGVNTTITNYTSGSPIQVSTAGSTSYTLVSVTGANGCVGTGNSGTAAITITPAASITTQPQAFNACIGGNGTVTVVPNTTNGTTYQYQVSTNGGATYTNITNGPGYSGATTATLTIIGATSAMNGYLYRVIVTGVCGGVVTSSAAPLSVNAPAVITSQPPATFIGCVGNSTTISVLANGNSLTYQWQVSTNGGTTFANVANGANYSGATTNALTLINIPATFLNYQYRVLVSSGGCPGVLSATSTLSAINVAPVTVISVAPTTTVTPGTTTTLTAATSPATGTIYQWFLNGVAIPGATGNTLVVGVDGAGTYTVRATTANGCFNSVSTPIEINITAAASNQLFIYPSPNNGVFQVRYYNPTATRFITDAAMLNVFDSKGSRVFTQRYALNGPYTQMDVNLGAHSSGIYRVELSDSKGNRLKTGTAMVF